MENTDMVAAQLLREAGVCLLPEPIDTDTLDSVIADIGPEPMAKFAISLENDKTTSRSLHVADDCSSVLSRVARLSRLVKPVQAFLGSPIYVYQLKINLKSAFDGKAWEWHQDYSFWRNEDGMMRPDAVTAAVFLDDVSDANGPMLFIPGSHIAGLHDYSPKHEDGNWDAFVSEKLPYATTRDAVKRLADVHGIIAAKGVKGSVFLFHSNVVHASAPNISPFPRRIAFITYSSVGNMATAGERPSFLVNRDPSPIAELESAIREV